MSDLSAEFDLHPSFNDTVWPAQIGDRPWWKKALTWCLIFGILIAFLFGAIVVLLNVNNQQLELLDKLEKNVQKTIISAFEKKHNVIQQTINSAFEKKHNVIANEIEVAIKHHFLQLVMIVGMATVLILITVKLWGIFKIALNGKNTPGKMAEESVIPLEAEAWWQFHSIPLPKCADFVALPLLPINLEGASNNNVIDNDGQQQQLLMADELPEQHGVREEDENNEQNERAEMNLRTHAREGNKLQKCAQCAYQTARANDMKKHTRIHSGIKPYKCTVSDCGYRSAQASDLMKHWRTHSGAKPYQCPFCDHQTAQGGNLKTHMRRNHPPGKKSRHLHQLH